jgi:branched-subunit amino acid aminotransferase/4-amino-4-deoxychorismate lyase
MANHLTPEELSKEMGIERQEVIRLCVEEGVPIYQGKIDKTLFQAQREAIGAAPQRH